MYTLTNLIDYPDYYINKVGQVYSKKSGSYKLLKPGDHGHGYRLVVLRVNGKAHTCTVHRLMAKTFLDFDPYLDVNHINGDKTDNRLENLEMCTRSENMQHALKTNLSRSKGATHHNAKLTEKEVLEIRYLLKNSCLLHREIGVLYNVARTAVSRIKTGARWSSLL